MEANLRNILILLSAIAIVAIFIHGLWTIRKNKNPYKLKTNKKTASEDYTDVEKRSFDGGGFDRDGVGQVKRSSLGDTQVFQQDVSINADEVQSMPKIKADTKYETQALTPDEFSLSGDDLSQTRDMSLTQTITLDKKGMKEELAKIKDENLKGANIYQEPVARAKPPRANKPRAISKSVTCEVTKEALKRNQMEINFGDAAVALTDEPAVTNEIENRNKSALYSESTTPAKSTSTEPKSETNSKSSEQLVIALSVVMPAGQQMMGATLLPMLLTLGLKYGDLNIFHRHQDNAGNGDVSFSLVNMMNPGTFNLDTMETFATPGVSLFMALPGVGDPFVDFEQMLSAAKNIAQEFNAQVIDDKRNVMTKQTEQHYVSKIREFDRQHRLANVE